MKFRALGRSGSMRTLPSAEARLSLQWSLSLGKSGLEDQSRCEAIEEERTKTASSAFIRTTPFTSQHCPTPGHTAANFAKTRTLRELESKESAARLEKRQGASHDPRVTYRAPRKLPVSQPRSILLRAVIANERRSALRCRAGRRQLRRVLRDVPIHRRAVWAIPARERESVPTRARCNHQCTKPPVAAWVERDHETHMTGASGGWSGACQSVQS